MSACGSNVRGEGDDVGPESEPGRAEFALEATETDACDNGVTSFPMETARVRTSQGIREVGFCRVSPDTVVFDGDVSVKASEFEMARADRLTRGQAVTLGNRRWPGGVVPFQVAPNLPSPERISNAIAEWERNTPFRFVARTTQADFVEFVVGNECLSAVGRQGGRQEIKLSSNCNSGSVMHEIGHAVGLHHEHTRRDRNDYITVNDDCIQPLRKKYFTVATGTSLLGPYDYHSVMHYPKDAFSNGCDSITPTTPGASIGLRFELSLGDVLSAYQIRFGSRPRVRPVPADYDGDGRDDMGLKDDTGAWRVDYVDQGLGDWNLHLHGYGGADTIPVPADYDGDGRADLAIKSNDGHWFIDFSSDGLRGWNEIRAGYGYTDVIPVPADYDGDGRADLAIKGNDGGWLIDLAFDGFGSWNEIHSGYGYTDVIPVPADYDGDGRADLAIKGNDGGWLIDLAFDGFGRWNETYAGYGYTDVIPVPADYDGDGRADLAIKGNDGGWLIDYAYDGFGAWNAGYAGYGYTDVIPVPADYDGDGRADLAVKGKSGAALWYVDYARDGFGGWNATRVIGG
jgi:hypothetical protein